jgi:hypothetical protein
MLVLKFMNKTEHSIKFKLICALSIDIDIF